jgi:hypothetical protein
MHVAGPYLFISDVMQTDATSSHTHTSFSLSPYPHKQFVHTLHHTHPSQGIQHEQSIEDKKRRLGHHHHQQQEAKSIYCDFFSTQQQQQNIATAVVLALSLS